MKQLNHQLITNRHRKVTEHFQGKTALVAKLLSMDKEVALPQVNLADGRKPTEGKVGDKRIRTAIYTITHTKLFTFG